MKSKYLSESQTVFLRKYPQSAEELKSEAGMIKEPTYWMMNQRSQAIGTRSKGGLGSKEMQRNLTNITKRSSDPHPLVDRVGEEVTQKHLNKLISAQLILKPVKSKDHTKGKGLMTREVLKDFLLYFLDDGTVKWMDMDTLMQNKHYEEMAYVKFLLKKIASVTNNKSRVLRTWLDRIFTRIREEFKVRRGGPSVFRLKCCTAKDEDEEIEFKILKVLKDQWGPYVIFKSTYGKFHDISIVKMLEFIYNPNDLRALHYQILCANIELIELKEKVVIALTRSEDLLLEAFLQKNLVFQVIQAGEETEED